MDSAGICWNPPESAGVCWNPLESTGICWNLPDSAGICWTLLVRSTGLCLVGFCRFQWNPVNFQRIPADSLQTGHANLAHVTLTKSGIWVHWNLPESGRSCGGVYSPHCSLSQLNELIKQASIRAHELVEKHGPANNGQAAIS